MLVQCLRTTMNATAPRPINAISAPYPGDFVVGIGVGATVVGGTVVAIVVTAGIVATTLGVTVGTEASRTLNSAVPVAVWRTAVSVTRYSSGLNVDESTSKEIAFRPLSPWVTLTVPVAPLNSPLWLLSVGLNDDE